MKIAQKGIKKTEIDEKLNAKYTLIVERNLIKVTLDFNSARGPIQMESYLYNMEGNILLRRWMEKGPWVNYPKVDHPTDKQLCEQLEKHELCTPKQVLEIARGLRRGRLSRYADVAATKKYIEGLANTFRSENTELFKPITQTLNEDT